MLHLYLTDKYAGPYPIIEDVEKAFLFMKLTGSDIERRLLRKIEQGEYLDRAYFLDRFGAKLPISFLSTGCKAAMVVLHNPTSCVDLRECGVNARDAIICGIPDGKCYIAYNDVTIGSVDVDDAIDVCVDDEYRFTSLERLNYYLMYEWPVDAAADLAMEGVSKYVRV